MTAPGSTPLLCRRNPWAQCRLRAGAAQRDITPAPGIAARNWGAATHDDATSIHRPLRVAALALQPLDEPTAPPLIWLSCDLGWWRTRSDEERFRHHLLDSLGLPLSHLVIHFTHTHAGPLLSFDPLSLQGGDQLPAFLKHFQTQSLEAARHAIDALQPALLGWASGACSLAHCRDLPDPTDPSRWLVGFAPDSPADPTLLVGRLTPESAPDRPLAFLVNYACHPTTLAWENRALSPDFPGACTALLEREYPTAVPFFIQGASGELAPAEQYSADLSLADQHGRTLAFAALSLISQLGPPGTALAFAGSRRSGAPLALWQRQPDPNLPTAPLAAQCLPLSLPLNANLPHPDALQAAAACTTDPVEQERLRRKLGLRTMFEPDAFQAAESVWHWRLGPAHLFAAPFEAYSAWQTSLRSALPSAPVLVANVSNGWRGYLPPAPLFEHPLYAVEQCPFAPGALESLINLCLLKLKT